MIDAEWRRSGNIKPRELKRELVDVTDNSVVTPAGTTSSLPLMPTVISTALGSGRRYGSQYHRDQYIYGGWVAKVIQLKALFLQ